MKMIMKMVAVETGLHGKPWEEKEEKEPCEEAADEPTEDGLHGKPWGGRGKPCEEDPTKE